MANVLDSPPIVAALVLLVSAVYAYWMWSRLKIGRYDTMWSSGLIICFQLLSAFHTEDPPLALVATVYHAALVAAVFTATRGTTRTNSTTR